MQSKPLENLRAPGPRKDWSHQFISNALAALGQIKTEDRVLAEHILTAEQALRKARAYLAEKDKA